MGQDNELGMTNLHFLSHSGLARQILLMKSKYPDLELKPNGVDAPVDKHGRTPFDHIPCAINTFKRIKKVSNYYRRILVQKKPKGKIMY